MEKELTVAELRAKLARAEREQKSNRDSYKELVDEQVRTLFPLLMDVNATLEGVREKVFEGFQKALELKADVYGIREDQQSHTFTTLDGIYSIKIGNRIVEGYDDTVDTGMAKIRQYLDKQAIDGSAAIAMRIVTKLLSRDRKGNLKASRIVELRNIAVDSGDEDFIEGVSIIEQSYRPQKSCQFIEASRKDENGVSHNIPLSISSL